MTPEEEKRDRLLKRILPALGITVIYYVFISGMLADSQTEAETEQKNMLRKGITTTSLPNIIKSKNQTQRQISTLESQRNEYKQQLEKLAGFMSQTKPSNQSSIILAKILDSHQILIIKEQSMQISEDDLSPALKEVWLWLKPTPSESNDKPVSAPINIQFLQLRGSYQNMYKAMQAIADGQLQGIPVSLTMPAPSQQQEQNDELNWELKLWM